MSYRADIVIALDKDEDDTKTYANSGSRTPVDSKPKPGVLLKVSVRANSIETLKKKVDGILATVDED